MDLNTGITRETAVGLLLKYNKEKFHIQHAVTVENVMKDYAEKLGYADEAAEWGIVGLLHDVDFEKYPEQHCIKAPELLREVNASDELTGLIGAAALMRPSKSVSDMELKSLKKKFKDKKFAAGCSREIISKGAEMLGWELDKLLGDTLEIMRSAEKAIANDYKELTGEEL